MVSIIFRNQIKTPPGFRGSLAEEAVIRIKIVVRFKLGILVFRAPAHRGAAAHKQFGVTDIAAGFIQHFQQRAHKHPAALARVFQSLLRFFARRQ
ncbi:MAG: hypothetical protein ALAOOOJD_02934 [bacterium]|nr:hypothetical protein [bacterium]